MATSDDQNRGVAASNPGPFVVSHPCPVCNGQGTVGAQGTVETQGTVGGQPCAACHGTGVGRFFHGTKAPLKTGDLIEPGHPPNFGDRQRVTTCVYLTGTIDAAIWGAELAEGEGRGRIYIVEPTGPIRDDPNLTDKKYPGNPSKSYRSTEPLRVVGEVTEWPAHSPDQLKAMRDGLSRLKREGVEPIDD